MLPDKLPEDLITIGQKELLIAFQYCNGRICELYIFRLVIEPPSHPTHRCAGYVLTNLCQSGPMHSIA